MKETEKEANCENCEYGTPYGCHVKRIWVDGVVRRNEPIPGEKFCWLYEERDTNEYKYES